ncbi:MAG: hypothetical protein VX793_04505 [Pseudomonadota bacterium]|nr:hypothetical protein [Pseudomonadota bacterium]
MIRGLLVILIMGCAAIARAQDCYYYWVHQCIDVIDASQRQLKQYVLISPAVNYLQADNLHCNDAVSQRQASVAPQLLDVFNQAAADIPACQAPINELPARVYDKPHQATWHYNRSRKASPQKTVIPLEGLPIL